MKKLILTLTAFLITASFAFSQPLLRQTDKPDNTNALNTGYLTWSENSPIVTNLEKAFKNYEANLYKKFFIAKHESKTGSIYVGAAFYPFADIKDIEHKMLKGFTQEKYLVPVGYALNKAYSTDKYPYTGEASATSFFENEIFVRLNKEELKLSLNHSVTLTQASKNAVLLSEPIEEKTERGGYTVYVKKPTAAELSKCVSSEGKVMKASGLSMPANDIGLERILNFFYTPKYYKVEVVFYNKVNGFDCTTPALKAKGIKCTVPAPAAEIKKGGAVVQFYVVPQIEALAKDFKFVAEALNAAAKK